jgi:hypothetical protein
MKPLAGFCLAVTFALPPAVTAGPLPASPDQAAADEPHGVVDARTYGTTAVTDVSLSAWAFMPSDSTVTYGTNANPHSIYRSNLAGSTFFVAPVNLPAGAEVVRIELQGCDNAAAADIQMFFRRQPRTGTAVTLGSAVTTGSPGCSTFLTTLTTPHTIDNFNNTYMMEVSLQATDASTRLAAARVGYRLQVSPAPATATFPNDVPTTHPFFRFVEALAAAGITGGCGAGAFCPDDAVTRGQMAVFLAVALGLHWAP